jgi:hypothetical protein
MTTTSHKFPWINTGAKTLLYFMKQRIKAPRVLPAPSTGDPAVDDTTRREFERVREQLNADYNDQRAALTDLEPLIYQLADQLQGWMSENEYRNSEREERLMNMVLMHRNQQGGVLVGAPGMPNVQGLPAYQPQPVPVATHVEQAPAQPVSPYEGQLLRGDGTAPVYKIENGKKRWIVTEQSLLANGFSWAQVRVVPRALVDALPAGNNIV